MNAPFGMISRANDEAAFEDTLLIANVSRRGFLKQASALGGLVLAAGFPGVVRAEDPPKYGADGMPHG